MKTVFKHKWGATLSSKECRAWGVDIYKLLNLAVDELNIRQFRIMSYWDEIEATRGQYNFKNLDKLLSLASKKGASVSLCLGLRQPRWPEVHEPDWAYQLRMAGSTPGREGIPGYDIWMTELNGFIAEVVKRYKNHPAIDSWQLENEALNRSFGINGDFNRKRLRDELSLVKMLDKKHPVIMSTSNSFALPVRRPRPDYFGFSWYTVQFKNGRYSQSFFGPLHYVLRGWMIRLLTGREVFIHELQCEPWGAKANTEMNLEEMNASMNVSQLKFNLNSAEKSKLKPYFLWGLEWWYAMKMRGEEQWWEVVKERVQVEY